MKTKLILFISMLFTTHAMATASLIQDLPKKDHLNKTTARINTLLNDGNITSGTSTVRAQKLLMPLGRNEDSQRILVRETFDYSYVSNTKEFVPQKAHLNINIMAFSGTVVKALAHAIAIGNDSDLDNPENAAEFERKAWVVLRALDIKNPKNIMVGVVNTRLKDDSSGEMREIYYYTFINKKTKKMAEFFVIEGSI